MHQGCLACMASFKNKHLESDCCTVLRLKHIFTKFSLVSLSIQKFPVHCFVLVWTRVRQGCLRCQNCSFYFLCRNEGQNQRILCAALGLHDCMCVWKSGKWKWREWERGRKNLMHHAHGFYSSMDIWQRFRFETCKQNCTPPSPLEFSITWTMWFYKQ